MRSLKTKFSLVIALLIIVVIGATAGILIQQKKSEIETDIYLNARSFGELTSENIANLGGIYLTQGSSLLFNRDVEDLLRKNNDITGVKLFTFAGQNLFDYSKENEVPSSQKLTRIKSSLPSVLTSSGQVVYLNKQEGNYELTDQNRKKLPNFDTKDLNNIENFIFPVNGEFAVQYDVNYESLFTRIKASAINIGIIAGVGILLSIIFGFILAGAVTRPITKVIGVVGQIAKGDFSKKAEVKTNDEVGNLATSVNKMAKDLKKATEDRIYKEKVKKELELAGSIQKDLLPKEIPDIKGLDVAGEVVSATEVGGDVFDIIQDSSGNSYFYVGDVTGHGVPAGIVSAVTNAIITSTVDVGDLDKILNNLNAILRKKTAKNLFLTLLLMKYAGKGNLQYSSAGHEQVMKYNAKNKVVETQEAGGIALAMLDDVADKLQTRELKMESGDVAIMYTDGIPEAWKNSKDQYGAERLQQSLAKYGHLKSAEEIKKAMLEDVKKFMGKYEQKDDITLVVIKKS